MTPRHALDAAINAVAAIEDNLSTSYSDAILSALAAEDWVLVQAGAKCVPHDDWWCECGHRYDLTREDRPAPNPAPLDVERLAVAFQRAWLWCDQHHPAGWSQTGDLVPAIAREYAALEATP